tara:strand:+ start:424 stop:633 length:210 start_codon:yes stop_codon:yes gene_type:complete
MHDPLVEDLKQIIRTLSKEVQELRDENEALWFMLEEIKESDKAAKQSMDAQQEEMMMKLLAGSGPVGEA